MPCLNGINLAAWFLRGKWSKLDDAITIQRADLQHSPCCQCDYPKPSSAWSPWALSFSDSAPLQSKQPVSCLRKGEAVSQHCGVKQGFWGSKVLPVQTCNQSFYTQSLPIHAPKTPTFRDTLGFCCMNLHELKFPSLVAFSSLLSLLPLHHMLSNLQILILCFLPPSHFCIIVSFYSFCHFNWIWCSKDILKDSHDTHLPLLSSKIPIYIQRMEISYLFLFIFSLG